jgi:hypothetical protein
VIDRKKLNLSTQLLKLQHKLRAFTLDFNLLLTYGLDGKIKCLFTMMDDFKNYLFHQVMFEEPAIYRPPTKEFSI